MYTYRILGNGYDLRSPAFATRARCRSAAAKVLRAIRGDHRCTRSLIVDIISD